MQDIRELIKVGSKIRSFEWDGETDTTGKNADFVEGIVEKMRGGGWTNDYYLTVRLTRRVWSGEDCPEETEGDYSHESVCTRTERYCRIEEGALVVLSY